MPVITDNCDPAPTVQFNETSTQTSNGACTDQNYTLTRTWTASDNCGNSAQITQVIEVLDTQPPVISGVPANITAECDAVPPPVAPAVSDNCDPTPAIVLSSEVTSGSCSGQDYIVIRTWVATDNCGNSSQITQVINIKDTQPPVLNGIPNNLTVECGAVPAPPVVSAVDNCDPDPAVDFSEISTQTKTGSCTEQT